MLDTLKPRSFLRILMLAAALLAVPSAISAKDGGLGINSGILKCNVGGGRGFLFASSKDIKCLFQSTNKRIERYTGRVHKVGLDIGYTDGGTITWAVFAPTINLRQGGLGGTYVGATAEATAGRGVGANILVGGTSAVSLQPLSISGQKGINIAAGIGSITLNYFQ